MSASESPFSTIDEALAELRAGRMIVLVDDEFRENEGDLIIPAERATPDAINFMMRNGCGLVCLSLSAPLCERLNLEPMSGKNVDPLATPFTPPIDARTGITTGTSAFDRARTVAVAIADGATANDLVRGKGHVYCLRAHPGGSMARVHDLELFCRTHGLKMCTIKDLINYRHQRERLVRRELVVELPTRHGNFDLIAYTSVVDPEPHLALCTGGVGLMVNGQIPVQTEPVLVRVHSQCLTGDIFESLLCDCGSQLHQAMAQVSAAGKGVVLYMRQEGRGIGLLAKLKAYQLQKAEGLDTVEANQKLGFGPDLRHYGVGAQILYDLGLRDIRLLTNNPSKVVGLDGYRLRIVERVPIQVPANSRNEKYLRVKREKLGHLLDES